MKVRSMIRRTGILTAVWLLSTVQAPAQVPTEEELEELERQVREIEEKEAAAKARAAQKRIAEQKAAAEARRIAAQREAEAKRRAAEEKRRADQELGAAEWKEADPLGEFVGVPGGTFLMGCSPGDSECDGDEHPAHIVSINAFRMGKYEVTIGQFRRFVEATGYRTDAEMRGGCYGFGTDGDWGNQLLRNWTNPGFPQTDRHPVICVSWNDAKSYVQWLSRQGRGHYRLPSESEWEYAARAGGAGRYSYGESAEMLCNYANVSDRTAGRHYIDWMVAPCDDKALNTAAVGGYRSNGFGLHDMLGNVWEWTEDCYHESYHGAPSDNAPWSSGDCTRRVLRGGSWFGRPKYARSSTRNSDVPGVGDDTVGFRLVQEH